MFVSQITFEAVVLAIGEIVAEVNVEAAASNSDVSGGAGGAESNLALNAVIPNGGSPLGNYEVEHRFSDFWRKCVFASDEMGELAIAEGRTLDFDIQAGHVKLDRSGKSVRRIVGLFQVRIRYFFPY